MMNFHTISFLRKNKIALVAVTMSFQATVRDEPPVLNRGAFSNTTKFGVPYQAAKHGNERRNVAAVMLAASSICRALVTMQTNRHTYAFLLLSWYLVNTGPK